MDFDLFYVGYITVWCLVLFQGLLALVLLGRLEELRDLMKQLWREGAEEDFQKFVPLFITICRRPAVATRFSPSPWMAKASRCSSPICGKRFGRLLKSESHI